MVKSLKVKAGGNGKGSKRFGNLSGTGMVGMGRSDLSGKGKGVTARKPPTTEAALIHIRKVSSNVRRTDQVTSSFSVRAREAKLKK